MTRYDAYVERYCRNGRCKPEEAHKHALVREVKKYYDSEENAQHEVYQEFTCCSEN